MNKNDLDLLLIELLPGLRKRKIRAATTQLLQIISDRLAAGGRIDVEGFGSFSRTTRKARAARNPITGESVAVPARNYPRFKAHLKLEMALFESANLPLPPKMAKAARTIRNKVGYSANLAIYKMLHRLKTEK